MGRKKKIEIENFVEIEQAREAVFSARGWRVRPWEVTKGDTLIISQEGEGIECYVSNTLVGTVEIRAIVEKKAGEGDVKNFEVFAARFDRELTPDDSAEDWGRVIGHLRASEIALSSKRKEDDGQILIPEAFEGIDGERRRVERLRDEWEAKLEELEDYIERIAILKEEAKPIKKASSDAREAYREAQRTLRKLEKQAGK